MKIDYYRYFLDKPVDFLWNWKNQFTFLNSSRLGPYQESISRISNIVLPLAFFFSPRSVAATAYVTSAASGIQAYHQMTRLLDQYHSKENFNLLVACKNIFKQGAIVLSCFDSPVALFFHNTFDLAEKSVDFYPAPSVEKGLEIVSNILYLSTLYPFRREISARLNLISMVYQSALSLYRLAKATLQARESKIFLIEALFHLATGVTRLHRAHSLYHHLLMQEKALRCQQLFVLIPGSNPCDLTPVLEKMRQEYGKDHLQLVCSEDCPSEAAALAASLKTPFIVTSELNHFVNTVNRRKERRAFRKLSPDDQWNKRFNGAPESQAEAAQRVIKTCQSYLKENVLTIFITERDIQRIALQGLQRNGLALPPFGLPKYHLFGDTSGQLTLWERASY